MDFATVNVALQNAVATVELNRPEKANAMEPAMWRELAEAMRWADEMPEVRAVVISGVGRHFTAGIDLAMVEGLSAQIGDPCPGRSRERLRHVILDLQASITAIEACRKPVIAAVHGACVGAGVDLISACDLRYCSIDARFTVKEIDIGIVADVGTLQRLPRLIGEGMARELAYTGRVVTGDEARDIRLVNRCFETPEALREGALAIARDIAAKSPLAIRGCKEMITYARDHSVADSLNYAATWNAAMLLSEDLAEAGRAAREQRPPKFRD